VTQAKIADKAGIDVIALGEHHRRDFAVSAPEVALAAIAEFSRTTPSTSSSNFVLPVIRRTAGRTSTWNPVTAGPRLSICRRIGESLQDLSVRRGTGSPSAASATKNGFIVGTMVVGDKSHTTVARDRILLAAAELLAGSGRDAVTTRSVAAAAGVQPPAIYRLFGDKDGLLDAVAEQGVRDYLASKVALDGTADPVMRLAAAWNLHIRFGFAEPATYLLVFAQPRPAPARNEAIALLRRVVERVAAAGRLRTSVERAIGIMHATGVGVVVSQLALAPADRDMGLPAAEWESVRATIVAEAEELPVTCDEDLLARYAGGLRQAVVTDAGEILTRGERGLIIEWLDRLATGH
jgi:AcrR family transcriptional regulator